MALRRKDAATEQVFFLIADHLGSTGITANPDGSLFSELRYKAWGEERFSSGAIPTDYRFTGQRQDSYINLIQMGSRWYDSQLGRWTQPDTLIPDQDNPLSYDRYQYVNSNPVKSTDPTGHCVGPLLLACIVAANFIVDNAAVITAITLTAAITLPWVSADTPSENPVNSPTTADDVIEHGAASLAIADIGNGLLAFGNMGKSNSFDQDSEKTPTISRYSKTEFQGRTVYQRNDIDWNFTDPETGLTNIERAKKGWAPIGPDGEKINLHHLLQEEPGPMAEVPATVHRNGQQILHGQIEPGQSFRNDPTLLNQYNQFRINYWKWRALEQ